MITVILNKDNIVVSVMTSTNKPNVDLQEGQSIVEVTDAPALGLEYDSSNKIFVKSNKTEFSKIRVKRDLLLSQSDYTQLYDSTYPNTQDAWKTYRQKLRDITKGVTDPDKIVFPEEPK